MDKDPKTLIEYSNNMRDVYKTIEECNLYRKCKVFSVFGDIIAQYYKHNIILQYQKMLD